MVARAMRQVFDTLRGERDRATGQLLSFDAKISFFQITNEKVYDLLGDMGGYSNNSGNNGSSNGGSSNGGGGSNGNSNSGNGSTTMMTCSRVSEPLQLYEDPTIAAAVSAGSYAVAAAAITALLATNNNNTVGNNASSSSSASSSNNVTSNGGMTTNTNTNTSSSSSSGVSDGVSDGVSGVSGVSGGVSGSHLVSIGGGVFVKGLNEVSVVDDGEVAALVERGLRARASDKHTNGSDSHVFLRLSLTVAGQYLFRLTPTLIYILLTPTGRTHMLSYDYRLQWQVSIYLD